MAIRYKVTLTKEERVTLTKITKDGKTPSKKFLNARALLLCDSSEGRTPWKISDIAEALGVTTRTIENLKRRFFKEGLKASIKRKIREKPPIERRYDGLFDARLVQLACSEAPTGYTRWTVRLLAEKVVELKIAPACSPMTVSRSLKKTNFNLIEASTGKSRRNKMHNL